MKVRTNSPLFNPHGDRDWQARRIIGGNSTRLIELNNVKYPWAVDLYRNMMQNFWIPEEVPLARDRKDYLRLPESHRQSVNLTLSFLIFLDSLQTVNLPNLAEYITAPEISLCLTVQAFQEAVHSQSYAYLLDSIADTLLRDMVYNYWRQDAQLMQRNRLITELYQQFLDHPGPENLLRAVIANCALEGIYFFSGFAVFYALARSDRMMGTASIIRYIQRDELTHLVLFQHLYLGIVAENPGLVTQSLKAELQSLLLEAAQQEIAWGTRISAGIVTGITDTSVRDFIRFLTNQRATALGWTPLFPEHIDSPYPWFDAFSHFNQQKTDFFEQRVLNYAKSSSLDWDSIS
ncbi:MAG: ribonucleotide-diphosphate reductase subunit beta [Firmicutes bacterium]|nr:ribonucleotide-diphosphate reductase subunit beta [Bacillota bacterium]